MLKEFKEFAVKGNVIDMAVGVVIGGSFGKIVSSLINDIIMPVVGKLIGGVDFSHMFISLDGKTYKTLAEAQELAAPTINYGVFINTIIEFIIIAFSIFMVVKAINKLKKEEEEEVITKECPFCKSEINIEATRCPNCTSELKEA
ncbi:MAG: large conductance mechanosensitive channel protein MscL [Tissierellia bacterium]|nr:large conductance mechanosensitive channel protein MscL [Tissierellia bacterium]